MSARELIVLGTSSQVPTRYRNHNGYLLRWDDHGVLFDPGEGTQRQMIYAGVTTAAITRICVTHFHGDHCLGLAGVSQRISLDRVPHEIPVHYPASGQVYFDRLRHASIFHDVAHITPRPIRAAGVIHEDTDLVLSTLPLDHGVEAWGYRLEERPRRTMLPDRLAAAGIRGPMVRHLIDEGELVIDGRTVRVEDVSVPRPGQVFAFVMDTRMCENALALARGADLLVCEATYLSCDAELAHDHGHLTAAEAATIARDAGVRRLVLTHFSQRYTDIEAFVAEARAIHPDTVAARDCDVIPVPRRLENVS
ncbi:MAG TPA: ribonuclease Z [Nannocystis sp.]